MAETWYLRTSAGAACGPGDRESLSQTAGAANATKALDATGDTWNRTESARSILGGAWTVYFDCAVGGGGGPQNTVNVLVEKRNSSCGTVQTLINQTVDVAKSTTAEYSATATLGEVSFSANDILVVILTATAGSQTKTLQYNNAAGTAYDSRLVHPDPVTTQAVSASDTATAQTTETSSILVTDTKTASDTASASSSETAELVRYRAHADLETRTHAGIEALGSHAEMEVDSGGPVAKTASDTATVQATETSAIQANRDAADTATVQTSESVAIQAGLTASDTATAQATETSAIQANATASDTASASTSESAAIQGNLTASDTATASISETALVETITNRIEVNVADTATAQTTETAALDIQPQGTDTATASISEATAILAIVDVADTATAQATETTAILATVTAADTAAIQATEQNQTERPWTPPLAVTGPTTSPDLSALSSTAPPGLATQAGTAVPSLTTTAATAPPTLTEP